MKKLFTLLTLLLVMAISAQAALNSVRITVATTPNLTGGQLTVDVLQANGSPFGTPISINKGAAVVTDAGGVLSFLLTEAAWTGATYNKDYLVRVTYGGVVLSIERMEVIYAKQGLYGALVEPTEMFLGGSNQFIISNGTTNSWSALSSNATLSGNGIGTALGLNLANANTWSATQTFSAGITDPTAAEWAISNAGAATFASIGVATRGSGAFTTLNANSTLDVTGVTTLRTGLTDDSDADGAINGVDWSITDAGAGTFQSTLDVTGVATFANTVQDAGTADWSINNVGTSTFNGNMTVLAGASSNGLITFGNDANAVGLGTNDDLVAIVADINVNSGQFTIDGSNGFTHTEGELDVDGATYLNNILDLDGLGTIRAGLIDEKAPQEAAESPERNTDEPDWYIADDGTIIGYQIYERQEHSELDPGTSTNYRVATLDNDGKLRHTQVPDGLLGAVNYQGTWNPFTDDDILGNPLPAAAAGNKGWYYVANTAANPGAGQASFDMWAIGDWIISTGTAWQKVDNSSGNANKSLSNLANVGINLSLLPNTPNDGTHNKTIDLGGADNALAEGNLPDAVDTDTYKWRHLWMWGNAHIDGDVIVGGTIREKYYNWQVAGGVGEPAEDLSTWIITDLGDATFDGNMTVLAGNATTGTIDLGDMAGDLITITGTLQGATPLVFDGVTTGGNTTTFAITDPTAARTITFPDVSGTVVVGTATPTSGNILVANGTNWISTTMSGDATIVSGGAITVANDSHSHTSSTLPATTSYLGNTIELTSEVTGILPSANGGTGVNNGGRTLTIAANSGTISFTGAGTTLTVAATASVSGTNTGDQTTITGNAGTATALATPRAIYGNNFDGSAALTQVISPTYGGTGVNNSSRTLTVNTSSGTLDFTSAVTLTVAAAASVSGTNTGDSREIADEFTPTASQTAFTLSQTPSTNSKVKMYINGVRISNTAYSWTGASLTYVPASNGGYALLVTDRVQFDFYY